MGRRVRQPVWGLPLGQNSVIGLCTFNLTAGVTQVQTWGVVAGITSPVANNAFISLYPQVLRYTIWAMAASDNVNASFVQLNTTVPGPTGFGITVIGVAPLTGRTSTIVQCTIFGAQR